MDYRLQHVPYAALPGWQSDDPTPLFAALERCRRHVLKVKPYNTGSLGITAGELLTALNAATHVHPGNAAQARQFFETGFQPFRIIPDSGSGFVTAFYEPEVDVSATRTSEFAYPFYRRPVDLVDVDNSNRPDGWDASYAFGQQIASGIVPYADRQSIELGFLEGQGLEIAFARSKADVFFAHVQGAARLRYPDGTIGRITYAAKSGHPFTPIGKLLIERGEIAAADISMNSIRSWLAENPERMDEVLWRNRSFIFFREAPVDDSDLGPIAAAKVPLVAGRSLAVDKSIHTFGLPFFVSSESLTHMDDGPFQRLMLALDTGSAIVGAARGDIFIGSGDAAGALASGVRNAADFYLLIPNAAAARYRHD